MPKITYVLGRPAARTQNTAAGQVQNVLGPQLQQQAAYGEHQNAVIQSFARSLLGKLQPVAGQVGADYDAAIKQIGGLSGQAAQFLSGQNPTASQQALTSAVGAPASQQAQQAQALGDTFQGGAGVLAFTGGTIPGAQLAGNKAAAQAQARTLPAIAALKGQQDLSSALWQQTQDRNKIEAQRPGLVQDAQAQIDETRIANAKIAQAEQAARATAVYRQQQINLGYDKLNQSAVDKAAGREETKAYHDAYLTHLQNGDTEREAHNKATEAATAKRLEISQQNADTSATNATTSRINATTSRYRATHPTASTRAPTTKKINGVTYQWDAKQQGWVKSSLPTEKPKAGKAKTGQAGDFPNLTKTQVLHLRGWIANAFYGVPKQTDVNGQVTRKAAPATDYQTAIDHAVQFGGYSRAGATKMANRFYKPGQRGRPWDAPPGVGGQAVTPPPPPGVAGPTG